MKRLYLIYCVLFLWGLLGCQEEIQKNETLADFEKLEKSLPTAMLTDTSFLAFKEHYLYMRDYTGTRPDSIEMTAYMECIEQYMQADSANNSQIDNISEIIPYMLGIADEVPEIVENCNLDGNQVGNYIRSIFQLQIRIVDLSVRYKELENDKNPWAALFAELNLPEVTPEYWENR